MNKKKKLKKNRIKLAKSSVSPNGSMELVEE